MNKMGLLQRAAELVLIRHGVAEGVIDDSYSLAAKVAEADDLGGDPVVIVATAIDLAVFAYGIEAHEGIRDDAEFLLALAKGLA